MPREYRDLEALPHILKRYLALNNGGHVLLIDSHIPTLDIFLNNIIIEAIKEGRKMYILYREIFDLIPVKTGYIYGGGELIILRRVFRDEDLIQAIKLLPKEKTDYNILVVVNPFKYLSEKKPGYATKLMNKMIRTVNRILPLDKPLLIYNEHGVNQWRICSKIKQIRHNTYIKITRTGNLYIQFKPKQDNRGVLYNNLGLLMSISSLLSELISLDNLTMEKAEAILILTGGLTTPM